MRKNILKWFGHVEERNNDNIVKKVGEIRVKGNSGRDRSMKLLRVIEENMRAYGINYNMVRAYLWAKGKNKSR